MRESVDLIGYFLSFPYNFHEQKRLPTPLKRLYITVELDSQREAVDWLVGKFGRLKDDVKKKMSTRVINTETARRRLQFQKSYSQEVKTLMLYL